MNSYDIKFLKDMITHHMMALKMATLVIQKGEDEKVKSLAQSILIGQQKEIDEMKAMLIETKAAKMIKTAEEFCKNKK